jgi:ceramide glucosyltransferase
VIFGVQSLDDPAVAVVHRLIREFSRLDLRLLVDARTIGTNRKAGNLANLVRQAMHDIFILADSDMRVDSAYVRAVLASLEQRTVGLVTCLYYGVAPRGVASRLNACSSTSGSCRPPSSALASSRSSDMPSARPSPADGIRSGP